MPSDVLTLKDVHAIVKLLADMADLPSQPPARRRHVLEGLAKIVTADVWIWNQGRNLTGKAAPMAFSTMSGGYSSDEQQALHLRALIDDEATALVRSAMDEGATHHVTRTRRQLATDEHWYKSALFRNRIEATGLDDFIVSVYPIGEETWSAIGLWKAAEKKSFSNRDRCIVHVILGGLDALHRAGADVPGADHITGLTPRLREVLLLVLGGDGRKQIARKLKLSEHTVADYLKALHRHFNVSSRGELLSKFISGDAAGPNRRPN